MSENLIAVLLGIVEGLTEFIPVSSTGHMIIVGHMIGFEGNLAKIFDVVIQLGAILAVLVLYKERFARFLTKEGWQLGSGLTGWHIAAGCVPTMAFAFLVHSFIKKYLFSPATVAVGLVLGAFLMIYAEHRIKGHEKELVQDVDHISLRQALYIGFFQFLSLWPGFSRSGSTMGGALLVGVNRKAGSGFYFHHGPAHHGGGLSIRTAEESVRPQQRRSDGPGHRFCHRLCGGLSVHRLVHEIPSALHSDRFRDLPDPPGPGHHRILLSVRKRVYKISYSFSKKAVDNFPKFHYTYPCYERKALA